MTQISRHRTVPILLWIAALILLTPDPANATFHTSAYAQWLQDMERDAIAQGISPETARTALDNATLDERVIALDQKQPELTFSFDSYSRHIVSPERVREGRRLLRQNAVLLRKIAHKYGVAPQIIVALWGIESGFGRDSGGFNVIGSLVTLAYEGRRADFFRGELLAALRILDREHIPPSSLRGSWAGAMGQCQFMPSTYLRHAVDYNNDGESDIWDDKADIFASIANYLAAEGWDPDLTWGREVVLTQDISADEIGLDHAHSMQEWKEMGVKSVRGKTLPDSPLAASLIQPDGPTGRMFLVYDNFRALMRWNRSTFFAASAGLLADAIR